MFRSSTQHRGGTPLVPVHRRSYVRIDPKLLRVCATCKRKNARVQLIRMIRSVEGPVHLDKAKRIGPTIAVCDKKSCIAKALEKKQFDYWVKIPIGVDMKKLVLSS